MTEPPLSHGGVLPVPTDGDTGTPALLLQGRQPRRFGTRALPTDQPLLPLHPHEKGQLSPHLSRSCSPHLRAKYQSLNPVWSSRCASLTWTSMVTLEHCPFLVPLAKGKVTFTLTLRRD